MHATGQKIVPFVTNRFVAPVNGMRFTTACFGGINWSLGRLQTNADVWHHQEFAEQLREAIMSVGARHALAPSPVAFNAKIGLTRELSNTISLGDGVYMRRNVDAPMDGTFLDNRFDAGMFSAGGCGLIVAYYRNHLLFAHAGRESLLDRTWVLTEGRERSRKHVSVVDSILDAFRVPQEKMYEVRFWLLYFIKPWHFTHAAKATHAEHAAYNQAAIRFLPTQYGKSAGSCTSESIDLDLPAIAYKQCIARGVPSLNINVAHQYLPDGLPTTRGEEPLKRYLVVVART